MIEIIDVQIAKASSRHGSCPKYVDSLRINLDFQDFDEEVAHYCHNPVEGTAFMELGLR